jgi:hypothetical protein
MNKVKNPVIPKSVPIGSPIGQNERIEMQKQLAISRWLSNITERTNRRQYHDNHSGPFQGHSGFLLGLFFDP